MQAPDFILNLRFVVESDRTRERTDEEGVRTGGPPLNVACGFLETETLRKTTYNETIFAIETRVKPLLHIIRNHHRTSK